MNAPTYAPRRADAQDACLAALAARAPIDASVTLALAHPDDEAIGAGGQFGLFQRLCVVVASDGAPRDGRDAARLGHDTRESYARTRRAELARALDAGGQARAPLIMLDLPDGELVFALPRLIAELTRIFRAQRSDIVLTHAYEGGHPDHDALALACRCAAQACGRAPAIIEMPYYRAAAGGWARQSFADARGALRIRVDGPDWTRKCAMLDAHASQRDLLRDFRQPVESFRIAPPYNFTRPPNGGDLLYADVAPTLDPAAWLAQARGALT